MEFDSGRAEQHLRKVLRGHRCVFCDGQEFGVGPVVAPARQIGTPEDIDPDRQPWMYPVTCSSCGHVSFFAPPEDLPTG